MAGRVVTSVLVAIIFFVVTMAVSLATGDSIGVSLAQWGTAAVFFALIWFGLTTFRARNRRR